jgi:heavy metal efflux system protein
LGEAAQLESATAQLALDQAKLQRAQLQNDVQLATLEFQLLLNTPVAYQPADTTLLLVNPILTDTARLRQHPVMQSLAQEQVLALSATALEKSKLNPDFSLGLSSSTLRGVGADEVLYSGSKRFQSVQLGVAIPLFNQTQKNRIKAAQVQEQVVQQQYALTLQQLQSRLFQAVEQWQRAKQGLRYYQQTGLPQARALQANAQRQLQAGNIQYLEWLQLVNQSIAIESQYLETVKAHQLAVAEINYIFY